MKRFGILLAMAALLGGLRFASADATDPAQLAQATIDKAMGYLKTQQKPDFGWHRR